jgi:hypothetical protein
MRRRRGRVQHVLDAGVDRGHDRVAVLAQTQALREQVARADQQQPLGARERFLQGLGLREVGMSDLDTTLREIRKLLRSPRRRDDLPCLRVQ